VWIDPQTVGVNNWALFYMNNYGDPKPTVITGAGDFGIGTSAPAYKGHIVRGAASFPLFGLQNTEVTGYSGGHFNDETGANKGHFGFANASAPNTFAGKVYFGSTTTVDATVTTNDIMRVTVGATSGFVGVGDALTPQTRLHVHTGAVSTTQIVRLENTAGSYNFSLGSGSPEGVVSGSFGDEYTDIATGVKYVKTSNPTPSTGWVTNTFGSGAATRVAFWSDATTLSSDADFSYNSTTNTLSVAGIRVGVSAASSSTTNTALGASALAVTTGTDNTAVGNGALDVNVAGASNTAVGSNALGANVSGNQNTAIGHNALLLSTVSGNTAVGFATLDAATTATNNTAVGSNALGSVNTSGNNTAVGANAFQALTGGNNTAVGNNAGFSTTTGGSNAFLGQSAGFAVTTGSNNTAVGAAAMSAGNGAPQSNTALGRGALSFASTAAAVSETVGIGFNVMAASGGTALTGAIAIGHLAMSAGAVAVSNVIGIGSRALLNHTSGTNVVALGTNALTANTTGSSNTAVGNLSLDANVDGGNNTAVGLNALGTNISGNQNTAVGSGAGALLTGTGNTIVGRDAGNAITTGSENTVFGNDADVAVASDTNSIVIGSTALGAGSNTITMGNASTTSFRFGTASLTAPNGGVNFGNLAAGTARLQIGHTSATTSASYIEFFRNGGLGASITGDGAGGLSITSAGAATLPITRFQNATLSYRVFATNASPEGVITANIGDEATDVLTGNVYRKASGTATNTGWALQIANNQVRLLSASASVSLDFSPHLPVNATLALNNNTTFTTTGLSSGRSMVIRVTGDASDRVLSFPAWNWLTPIPTTMASGAATMAILSLTAFGTADTDVVAAWAYENAPTTPTGTGTANFAARWTGTSTLAASTRIFDDGTNVGIHTSSPTSPTHIVGAQSSSISTTPLTVNTALDSTHKDLLFDATAGNLIATLPLASSCSGREYAIKKTDSSANTVTVSASENIDGATTYVLSVQYAVVRVKSNGTQWWVF
jgi:hypothetical protein